MPRAPNRPNSLLPPRELPRVRIDAAKLRKRNVHAAIVPLARQEVERGRQHRGHEQVQDAKVDEAARDADDVAAVRDGEGDDVVEPQQVGPAGHGAVVAARGAKVAVRERAAALEEGVEGQEEPGEGAEGEEAPFVVGGCVGCEEVGEDPVRMLGGSPCLAGATDHGGGDTSERGEERLTRPKPE